MALLLALLGAAVNASPPLRDLLTIDGETAVLYSDKQHGISGFPWSPALRKIARNAHRCSALGAPTGHYELRDGRLWLVGFGRCGPALSLNVAYGKPTPPILADWLNGRFWSGQGALLCHDGYGESIWQTQIELLVEQGRVRETVRSDQSDNPRVRPGHCLPGHTR